jgi:hypothetical protein
VTPGKPVNIQKFIGRRPVLAFGNCDGKKIFAFE